MILSCKKTRKLTVPVGLCGNDEELYFEFEAGVPLDVPEAVATQFARAVPTLFSLPESEEQPKESVTEEVTEEFDAVGFLTTAAESLSEETLSELTVKELHAVVKALEIKNVPKNTGKPKLIHRILNFVNKDNGE